MTTDDRVRAFVDGLPEASGTFTGTLGPDADVTSLTGPAPDLLPVEIDTYDQPNLAAGAGPGQTLTVRIGDREWAFPVDHTEVLGGNRVRVWVRRPAR